MDDLTGFYGDRSKNQDINKEDLEKIEKALKPGSNNWKEDFLEEILVLNRDRTGNILMWQDEERLRNYLSAVNNMGGLVYNTETVPENFAAKQRDPTVFSYITASDEISREELRNLAENPSKKELAEFHDYPKKEIETHLDPSKNTEPYQEVIAKRGATLDDQAIAFALGDPAMIRNSDEAAEKYMERARKKYSQLEKIEQDQELPEGYLTDLTRDREEVKKIYGTTYSLVLQTIGKTARILGKSV